MRRICSTWIAAFATTSWLTLATGPLAHGQATMYGGQPYGNPAYQGYPSHGGRPATPQPAVVPRVTMPTAPSQPPVQPQVAYHIPAAAPGPRAYMPAPTNPGQAYSVYQAGQPAGVNQQPMYLAQANLQPGQDPAIASGYPPASSTVAPAPWGVYPGNQQGPDSAGSVCDAPSAAVGASCGPMMTCAPPITWEVYGGALMMFRDNENHHFYSFDSATDA